MTKANEFRISGILGSFESIRKSGILKAFKQLETAEVDPYLLAYSITLNKEPDSYQPYTAQHKIGKLLNKESGSLIKYYKTGQQEDGYKGYSTNYVME